MSLIFTDGWQGRDVLARDDSLGSETNPFVDKRPQRSELQDQNRYSPEGDDPPSTGRAYARSVNTAGSCI